MVIAHLKAGPGGPSETIPLMRWKLGLLALAEHLLLRVRRPRGVAQRGGAVLADR